MSLVRRTAMLGAVGALLAVPAVAANAGTTGGTAAGAAHLIPVKLGCATSAQAGRAHCYAEALGAKGQPYAATSPTGYGAADIRSAYGLSSLSSGGRTVAIVDAYDDKTAESDLATYRSTNGLAPCTTANGCFKKLNQNGVQGSYPSNNVGWATEISLDLDAVSAACPDCHITLVEATSNSNVNLYAAEDTAARQPGVVAISNSYGGSESSSETSSDSHFNHPGIAITVSSGDSGYGVEYPAASRYVTAVGGTSLNRSGGTRGWSETTWSGAGSGCSAYEAKQSWQTDSGCARRTVADVAAVADPNTGLGVYDTNCNFLGQVQGSCFSGWATVGGTSLSSPLIASVYALAGNTASITYGSYPYAHTSGLNDVTSGSNGSCSGSYLCTAKTGYDGPTGLGTPNGATAF
ncbi:MAG: peptidase S8 [Actinomycetes bacterium]